MHAEWQGKVYSLSGETKGYDKLADATGYGTGAGLMGWNCNHSFAPFFEGSKRNYTDEQLRDMKEHTVTYDGKKMPDYEASQLQRSMERDIRKTKRELTALDELQKQKPTNETKTEFAALSVKLKNQEARLKNFCRQTERRMDTTRTGVFASQSGMGFGRSTSAKAVWANRKSLTAGKKGDTIQISGAVSGALNPESDRAATHAKQYYEAVRHMTTDCKRIAENTGYSEAEIKAIKDYIFMDEHTLLDGITGRFAPSYEMGQSWQRLIDGKNIQEHDLTMLKHEVMEKQLMENGYSQDEAHIITSRKYNYEREAREYYDKVGAYKKK